MTQEQLDTVNAALKAAFGDGAPVAHIDDEYIAVENTWTIGPTEVDQPSIRGTVKVPGFVLEVGVPYHGSDIEPPGVDVAEVYVDRAFAEVVLALVAEVAKARANVALENLATEAFVRQMEGDDRLAKEYWASAR